MQSLGVRSPHTGVRSQMTLPQVSWTALQQQGWRPWPCQQRCRCRCRSSMPDRSYFDAEEYSFSLSQYMVVLDKPIGITLAPDPKTGQVYVQHIHTGLSAAGSRLVLVGDRLLSVSAVFGDEMWPAADLQRTRWAINNRPGKVKLIFERTRNGHVPPWYSTGREGTATWEVPELQLPIRFTTPVGAEIAESLPGVGRSMSVSFNRCLSPPTPSQARHPIRPGLVARQARSDALIQLLHHAAAAPKVDISTPISRALASRDAARAQSGAASSSTNVLPFRRNNSSNNNSSGSNNSSGVSEGTSAGGSPNNNCTGSSTADMTRSSSSSSNTAGSGVSNSTGGNSSSSSSTDGAGGAADPPTASASAADATNDTRSIRERRVIQVLPWLLVSHGRLHTGDIARIATNRGLGMLLEMALSVNHKDLLCSRGSQAPVYSPPAEPVPPTLSPSETPKPAPVNPPPLPTAAPEQQQQLERQQQQSQQQQGQQQTEQQQQQLATKSAESAGSGAPDTGAAAGAAAVDFSGQLASSKRLAAGDAGPDSSSSSSTSSQPTQLTLQAHSILYCMTDLHRLSVRRRWTPHGGIGRAYTTSTSCMLASGVSVHSALGCHQRPGNQLLLNCEEGSLKSVAVMLVGWLHWLCGVEQAGAIEAVRQALDVVVDTAMLAEVHRLLVICAKERFSRLLLSWPYGGLSAEVSGELVGGWTERIAMKRCLNPLGCLGARKGTFYLELKGLHPGKYHYKYIIDNTWAVDPFAPKTLDSQGNWNNVLEVHPSPRIETDQEQAHFAALQAMHMAFERKLQPV